MLKRFLSLVLLLGTSLSPAAAHQLPDTVRPTEYRIDLHPDLQTRSLTGQEDVTLQIARPTRDVVLNAVDMHVYGATLDGHAARTTLDAARETVTIHLSRVAVRGPHHLSLSFSYALRSERQGLFYNRYPEAGHVMTLIATEMEPSDARRAFPCWDEPDFRARFQLSATVPTAFLAVSNMPVAHEKAQSASRKQVVFAETPPMATYLVAFVAGPLETIGRRIDGIPVRVVARHGQAQYGTYALDVLQHVLPFYRKYFGIAYPLPKMDLIALPGGYGDAMENWGAITYDETLVLFKPGMSSPSTRETIFNTVAHETAHQWFGDLVTMEWWDNLWLNEGFATWMALKAEEVLEPQWDAWERQIETRHGAMDADARAGAHPIQQPIRSPGEADSVFDSITYDKGASVIRMLESYLGPDVFMHGLQLYMHQHQFGNARTRDLWKALAEASGQPVEALAQGWTTQPGFPVVTVAAPDASSTQLSQSRFHLTDKALPAELWQIPITEVPPGPPTLLTSPTGSLPDATWSKLNRAGTGYYRIRYQDDVVVRVTTALPTLSPVDQANLLDDAWALMLAGQQSPATALAWLDRVPPGLAWAPVLPDFELLVQLEPAGPAREAWLHWLGLHMVRALETVGWDAHPDESPAVAEFRSHVLQLAGLCHEPSVLAEARRRFDRFEDDPASLAPALRVPVLNVVGQGADAPTWIHLLERARGATTTEERQDLYRALSQAQDAKLAQETLKLTLGSTLTGEEAARIVKWVSAAGHHALAWAFATTHRDRLVPRLSVFDRVRFLPALAAGLSDTAQIPEVRRVAALKEADNHLNVREAVENIERHAWIRINVLPIFDTAVSHTP